LKLSNEEGHTKLAKLIEEKVMNCFCNQRVSQYQINHNTEHLVRQVDNILLWTSFGTTRHISNIIHLIYTPFHELSNQLMVSSMKTARSCAPL